MPSKGHQDKVGWYRITATPAYLGLVVRQLLEGLGFTPSPAVFAFYRAIDMSVKYDFIRKPFVFEEFFTSKKGNVLASLPSSLFRSHRSILSILGG